MQPAAVSPPAGYGMVDVGHADKHFVGYLVTALGPELREIVETGGMEHPVKRHSRRSGRKEGHLSGDLSPEVKETAARIAQELARELGLSTASPFDAAQQRMQAEWEAYRQQYPGEDPERLWEHWYTHWASTAGSGDSKSRPAWRELLGMESYEVPTPSRRDGDEWSGAGAEPHPTGATGAGAYTPAGAMRRLSPEQLQQLEERGAVALERALESFSRRVDGIAERGFSSEMQSDLDRMREAARDDEGL